MGKKKDKTEKVETEKTEVDTIPIEDVVETISNPNDFFEGMQMLTVIQLKEAGHGIRGIFEGTGGLVAMGTENEQHEVNTYKIKTRTGLTVRLMGSIILDRELEAVEPGTEVAILRGRTVKNGAKQLTYYQVAVSK